MTLVLTVETAVETHQDKDDARKYHMLVCL